MVYLYTLYSLLIASLAITSYAEFKTLKITQNLDHLNRDSGTFKQIVKYIQGSPNAPIFIFTGGEHDLDTTINRTGFIQELRNEFDATLLYVEHRYIGQSEVNASMQYLTLDQVLYDYATVVRKFKTSNSQKVIALGAEYSGNLATFFRLKYPHLIDGAVASSAGMLTSLDKNGELFYKKLSQIYYKVSPTCYNKIKSLFTTLSSIRDNVGMYSTLAEFLNLYHIPNETSIDSLMSWILDAFSWPAAYNYPYPVDEFDLPSDATAEICKRMKYTTGLGAQADSFAALGRVIEMVYNYKKTSRYIDFSINKFATPPELFYLSCFEMPYPVGSNGVSDIFLDKPWNYADFANSCKEVFNITPRWEWYEINFGLSGNYANNLKNSLTNVMLTYGEEDPFSAWCIQSPINSSMKVVGIKGAAHAHDFRTPHDLDSESVREARKEISSFISNLIKK